MKDLVLTRVTDNLDSAMMIQVFQHELSRVLDEHAPIITKRLPTRLPKLWFNEDIKEQKQKVQRRERIWRKFKENHQWLAFKEEKQKYRGMLKEAKINTVSNLIMECYRDIRKLYQVIYNITDKHSINPLPDSDSDKELADTFACFFINKIRAIRDQLNEHPKYNPQVNVKTTSMTLNKFNPMSAEDIMLIIKSMASKSCELDVVPTTLLKDILPYIIDTLVKIINVSLEQGVFAENGKWP